MLVCICCSLVCISCSSYDTFKDDKNDSEIFYLNNKEYIYHLYNLYNENPVSFFGIDGDKISLRVFDSNHDSLLYNFNDVSIKKSETLAALNHIRWSETRLNNLKRLMNTMHCSSIRMIPYDKKTSEPSPLLITCALGNWFDAKSIGFEIHHDDFSPERTAWIKHQLEDKRRGGLVTANALWYYIY